jgi:alpha-2-macroglobulin
MFHFFAENIPSGKHEISYELKVSHEGSFISGPAALQCMYKPEISAYSLSSNIITAH